MDKPVTLPCEADGLPPPGITWHKDGHAVVESVRQRILSSGALQIAFAQPEDAGQYTCTAANVAGSRSSSTRLTVHGRWFHANHFSLLHDHGKEQRLLRRHLVEIKTMQNQQFKIWCVRVYARTRVWCRYTCPSNLFSVGILYLCVSTCE